MIVVVGSPIARPAGPGIEAAGLSAAIARAAAAAGASVQVVGRVGEDAAGDQVLLALAAAGIGHVAVLREPGRPTPTAAPSAESTGPDGPTLGAAMFLDDGPTLGEATIDEDDAAESLPAGLSVDAEDLELALRYVPDYRVLVVAADLDEAALAAVVAAAGWSGAHLIALMPTTSSAAILPADATVLERSRSDPDGAFAAMVATYAVALDQGDEPAAAFASAQRVGGWAAVAD